MPSANVKKFAERSGKSVHDVERLWKKAKRIVKQEYKYDESNPNFWALVTTLTKRMSGIRESISFKEFLIEMNDDT